MPTHHDDIELVIGDEWVILGHLLDESGQPIDLTNANVNLGWTLLGADGNRVSGIADAATLEKQTGGEVLITVPDTFTRTLLPGRFMDSIRVWIDNEPATQWTGIILADADTFHSEVDVPTAIEDAPDDGQLYVRQGNQWVVLPAPPAPLVPKLGLTVMFECMFDSRLTAPPLNSQLRFNNANASQATLIWVNNNDADGLDVSNLLSMVQQGFLVLVQDKDDPTAVHRFTALAPVSNLGTYTELSVLNTSSGGPLNNNQRCFLLVYGGG